MTTLSVALLFLTVTALTTSAVLSFWWAGENGQFQELERGAMSVFDADEMEAGAIRSEKYHSHEAH